MHTYNDYDSVLLWILVTTGIKFPMKYVNRKNNHKWKNKKKDAHDNKTPNQKFNILYAFANRFRFGINKWLMPPCNRKYAVQSISDSNHNRGSATLEAMCIMPMMLFAFWAFYSMGQIYILENQIYQATMNTAGFLAEYAYLAEDTGVEPLGYMIANGKLREYLPDDNRTEQYVAGGTYGIRVTNPKVLDDEGFICLAVRYQVQIPVPFLRNLSIPIGVQVRQKAYTGYSDNGEMNAEEQYVYLAEYSSVYHVSRSCSHLKLTIIPVSEGMIRTAYSELEPCAYCGTQQTGTYYITETGDCYHTSMQCSGLKRTVRRVKLSEASGYAPCSRCGK